MSTNPDDALEQIANAPDFSDENALTEAVIELTDDDMGGQSLADFLPAGDDTQAAAAAAEPPLEGEPAADEAPAEPAPRQRPPRAQVRIEALTAERDAERQRAADLEARLERAAAAEAEAMHAAVYHHHAALKTQSDAIRAQLIEAERNGESEVKIDLQTRLNLVAADLREAEAALQQAPQRAAPREEPRAAPAPAPVQQPQAAPVPPETAAWISRNSWFQQGSPDFDAELADEARLYARSVERRYAAEGKINAIGSQAYFMEIDRHIRTAYPDAFDDPAPRARTVPPMSRDATVAPVVRGGAPAAGAPSGNSVRLSAEQRQFAHSMAANGAWNKPGGVRPTPAEAERIYAAQILKTQRTA